MHELPNRKSGSEGYQGMKGEDQRSCAIRERGSLESEVITMNHRGTALGVCKAVHKSKDRKTERTVYHFQVGFQGRRKVLSALADHPSIADGELKGKGDSSFQCMGHNPGGVFFLHKCGRDGIFLQLEIRAEPPLGCVCLQIPLGCLRVTGFENQPKWLTLKHKRSDWVKFTAVLALPLTRRVQPIWNAFLHDVCDMETLNIFFKKINHGICVVESTARIFLKIIAQTG